MYNNLPKISYARNLTDGRIIAIKRGVSGYYPYLTTKTVDELNQALGVTRAQAAAMQFGSMFGWDKQGANPDAYRAYNILQLYDSPEAEEMYMGASLEKLAYFDLKVDKRAYRIVYSGIARRAGTGTYKELCKDIRDKLSSEKLPSEFNGHKLSQSDIIQFESAGFDPFYVDFYLDGDEFVQLGKNTLVPISYDDENAMRQALFYGKIEYLSPSGRVAEISLFNDRVQYESKRLESWNCGEPFSSQRISAEDYKLLAERKEPENYLRNAELYTEQNYDRIDGLIDNVDTVQEEGTRTNQEKSRSSNESGKPDKSTKRHNKSRDIER